MIKEFIKKITTVIDKDGQEKRIYLILVPFLFVGNLIAAGSLFIHTKKDTIDYILSVVLFGLVITAVFISFFLLGNELSIYLSIIFGTALVCACMVTVYFAREKHKNNNNNEDI